MAREQALLALYDSVLTAAPTPAGLPRRPVLLALRAEHATHLAVLTGPPPAPGAAGSATSPPTGTGATSEPAAQPSPVAPNVRPPGPADLRAAEAAAAAAHADGVAASSRRLAALLASLSAAESAHAVPLS